MTKLACINVSCFNYQVHSYSGGFNRSAHQRPRHHELLPRPHEQEVGQRCAGRREVGRLRRYLARPLRERRDGDSRAKGMNYRKITEKSVNYRKVGKLPKSRPPPPISGPTAKGMKIYKDTYMSIYLSLSLSSLPLPYLLVGISFPL